MNSFCYLFCLLANVGLFVAVVQCGDKQKEWPIASYLYQPPNAHHERPTFNWIRQQVAALHRNQNITAPEQIRDFFAASRRQLAGDGSQESYLINSNLQWLVHLADVDDADCHAHLVEDYIEMVHYFWKDLRALTKPVEPEKDSLLHYLQHFGRAKFNRCARDVSFDERQYYLYGLQPQSVFDPDTEWAFDRLIGSQGAHYSPGEQQDDELHLAEVASGLDLVKAKFDGKRMLSEAQQYAHLIYPGAHKLAPADLLFEALWTYCLRMLNAYQSPLDAYNLDRLLKPPPEPKEGHEGQAEEPQEEVVEPAAPAARLLKLNEYARLCYQLRGSNTKQQVRKNIKKSFKSRWG